MDDLTDPKRQMTDYQKEVNTTIESFWQAAQAGRGRQMGEKEVKHVAAYISGLTEAVIGLENQVGWASNMLAAYTNEYGEGLLDTPNNENVVDAVVEGEIVDQANVELETNSSEGEVVDEET